ncbi:hypothetical protein pEaSNUABM8_00097 [Erwinia phage pEa_SNUABM_8]|nr:hypothetical protein pEaSNUABM8_00097 [Erwinia phage pEa_SNUABM_8]QVW54849.1 hypothetical protein pEaSNUABM4_00096 [Erwinia phage pEa_SNUABM_4]
MAITTQAVAKLCESRLNSDENLVMINNAVINNQIDVTEALDIAVRFGNVMATRSGVTEQKLADAIVAAYKSAAYKKLQQYNIGFNNDPQLHNGLNNMFQEVVTVIKNSEQSASAGGLTGGLRLGGLGGGGINAGGSLSIDTTPTLTSSPGLPIEASGGLNVSTGLPVTPAQIPAVQPTSPLASMPVATLVPDANQPIPALTQPVGNVNEPVFSPIEELALESYAEHELEAPKRRTSITAKEANDRVIEYAESKDWKQPLEDLILGTEPAVYYSGADIAVRLREQKRSYLVGIDADSSERFKAFVLSHNNHIEALRDLVTLNHDADKVIKMVSDTLDAMKLNVVQLYVASVKENEEVTETIVSEAVRFTNAYLGMLSMTVHNGISLATDRCTELPGKFKGVELERNMDDLKFFSGQLYQSTIGDNGYTNLPDFFRDLFMTVANSVSTLTVKMEGSATVSIVQKAFDILIPGNYPTLTRNSMVGKHSLGATEVPVTEIYEYLRHGIPDANVYLVAPQARYLLLSNGEPTAAIRY